MLISMLVSLITFLIIMAYIATSGSVTNYSETKMAYAKASHVFKIEKAIVTATERFCIEEFAYCKGKESLGEIELSLAEIQGHLPESFINTNLNGGSFSNITIKRNNSTISLYHSISRDSLRYIYLKHYKGKEYGTPPGCISGSSSSQPACNNSNVFHEYPTSMDLRNALE